MKKYFFLIQLMLLATPICMAQNFDIDVLKQTNLNRNTNLDNFFIHYSNTVTYTYAGTPILIYTIGIFKKDKKMQTNGINMAINAGINGAFTYALKKSMDRPRPAVTYPFLTPLENRTRYSFPSGHTSSAFNTATSLSMCYPKWFIIAPSFAYAGLMGYSRMHEGVHYPSDVFAGAVLGIGSAYLSKRVTAYLQQNKKTNKIYKAVTF